jgi:hypothetical protein
VDFASSLERAFQPKHAPGCTDNDCDRSCMSQPAGAADRTRGGAGAPDRVETIVFGLRHGHGYASLSPEACALLVAHIDALEQECATLREDADLLDYLQRWALPISVEWPLAAVRPPVFEVDGCASADLRAAIGAAARAGRPAGEGDR